MGEYGGGGYTGRLAIQGWVVNAMSAFEEVVEDAGRDTAAKLRDWNTITNGNRVFYDKQDGKEWTNVCRM